MASSQSTLKIGTLSIKSPVLLAPMAGYTDTAMRSVCLEMGAALVYTEVLQSTAIARRIPITLHALSARVDERPLVGHIYGTEPETMAAAARVIEETGRFALIDINCGCPVRKIVAKGAGAALMRDPVRIGEIVRTVKAAVGLPVTIKTRLGLTPAEHNVEEVAIRAQDAGADAITVHARYASVRHSGDADWDALAHIKTLLDIPVIGNGGVLGAANADAMMKRTGVDAVMVGRAAVGNPWVFREIRANWMGERIDPPGRDEKLRVIRAHLEGLVAYITAQRKLQRGSRYTPERTACLKFRGHLVRYLAGVRGVKELMRLINGIYTVDELMNAIATILPQGLYGNPS